MRYSAPDGATPIDPSGLIQDGILTYADLCAAEAENILQAAGRHLTRRKNPRKAWFTEHFVRRVHADMFGNVWNWAGKYRRTQTNIGAAPHSIREEVAKLCGDVEFWDSQARPMPVLERAARIHHRLALVHPFENGNGRHARMLSDIYLFSRGQALSRWSSEIGGTSGTRSNYIAALRIADAGDFEPLIKFIKALCCRI